MSLELKLLKVILMHNKLTIKLQRVNLKFNFFTLLSVHFSLYVQEIVR